MAGEREHLLDQALERLPEEYRRVIDLRCRQGLSFDQIGASLAKTPNSARKLCAGDPEAEGRPAWDELLMSQDDETTTRSVTATDPFGKTSPAQNFNRVESSS